MSSTGPGRGRHRRDGAERDPAPDRAQGRRKRPGGRGGGGSPRGAGAGRAVGHPARVRLAGGADRRPRVEAVHSCTPPDRRCRVARRPRQRRQARPAREADGAQVAEADEIAGCASGPASSWRDVPEPLHAAGAAGQARRSTRGGWDGCCSSTLNAKWYRTTEYYRRQRLARTAEREGGAVLINQAIHSIDLLRWICGPVRRSTG